MKFAVVQVRGAIGMNQKFKDTLQFLKLIKKNSCVVVDDDRVHLGMLIKLKDYVTWGEMGPNTFKLLLQKRGRIVGNKQLTEEYLKSKTKMGFDDFVNNFYNKKIKLKDVPGMKTYFRLTPPRGGFDRAGIKKQFSLGGALGYRGKAINDLVGRML